MRKHTAPGWLFAFGLLGGLPVGLQIVGRRREEAAVLRAAAAFEAAMPWADKRPPIAEISAV